MNLAQVSETGRFVLPYTIREKLHIKTGDKLAFIEQPDGAVVVENASLSALSKVQSAFEGTAKDFGVENEDDVQKLVDEIRYGETV
ncbi:hypothetical protein FACS18942_09730 [Planctomycetales bacterium]|nr:hypothetical protein FACS18942_09730 [Planctomycetales bacterium]